MLQFTHTHTHKSTPMLLANETQKEKERKMRHTISVKMHVIYVKHCIKIYLFICCGYHNIMYHNRCESNRFLR